MERKYCDVIESEQSVRPTLVFDSTDNSVEERIKAPTLDLGGVKSTSNNTNKSKYSSLHWDDTGTKVVPKGHVKLFESQQSDFTLTMLKIHELVKKSAKANFEGLQILVQSYIYCNFLDMELIDYEDRVIAKLMRFGAPISHERGIIEARETTHKNHSGAILFPEDIGKYIKKEQKYKSILEPIISNPFASHIQLSPLDLKPKDDSEERRVIVDLSFPKWSSVNSGISKDHYLGESMRCEISQCGSFGGSY